MISLEQVKQLEIRVKKAVNAVKTLSTENSVLKQQVKELEARLGELDREANKRRADEEQLEVSLQSVLDVLDEVDEETSEVEPDLITDSSAANAGSVPETETAAATEPAAESVDESVVSAEPAAETAAESGVAAETAAAGEPATEEAAETETAAESGVAAETAAAGEPAVETVSEEILFEEPATQSEETSSPASVTNPEPDPEDDIPETINLDSEKEDEGLQTEFDIF